MSDYTEDELRMYSAWSDYRSEYGTHEELTDAFAQFLAGWSAARANWTVNLEVHTFDYRAGYAAYHGTLDIGGALR